METPRESAVVLKASPARTVELREVEGERVVVKRFHHPGLLQRLRDPARARGEFEALRRLDQAGVRVPRPLRLVRVRGGAEVHMQAVPDALSLEDLLLGRAQPPRGWPDLCARLGRLVAALARAPVEHTDLHPGNVLVDARGEPWCVDFHAARDRRTSGERIRTELVRTELVRATAFARERVPVRARLRYVVRLCRELELERPDRERLERLELEARVLRRDAVEHGAGRWLRDSSRCSTQDTDHGCVYEARAFQVDGAPELVLEGSSALSRARWLAAARLVEHGLPAAIPRRLVIVRGTAREVYSRAVPQPARGGFPSRTREQALTRIESLLADRGLEIEGLDPGGLVGTNDGAFVLAPPTTLASGNTQASPLRRSWPSP